MKVRTSVKLLCDACKKVRVQVDRKKGYVVVQCTKNPRVSKQGRMPCCVTL